MKIAQGESSPNVETGVARRAVLRGAAWALPAVALAAAVPARAASPADALEVTHTSTWNPVQQHFRVFVVAHNPGPDPVTLYLRPSSFAAATYRLGWSYSNGDFLFPLAGGASTPAESLDFTVIPPAGLQPGEIYPTSVITTGPPVYATAVSTLALSY